MGLTASSFYPFKKVGCSLNLDCRSISQIRDPPGDGLVVIRLSSPRHRNDGYPVCPLKTKIGILSIGCYIS